MLVSFLLGTALKSTEMNHKLFLFSAYHYTKLQQSINTSFFYPAVKKQKTKTKTNKTSKKQQQQQQTKKKYTKGLGKIVCVPAYSVV